MDTLPAPSHSMPMPSQAEKPSSHIDQLPNDGSIITTANTASPPNHIRNMLLNQHHQQSSKSGGGSVITGSNPILMGHPSPTGPPPGHHMGGSGGDIHPGLSARTLANEQHPHSSNSGGGGGGGIMHPPAPMSPATPPSENPASVHNYGGWSYPQHAVLIGNEPYHHGMPLLPAVQANTPTTQNHFFKANF